jgi:penicillin-binding protein 1A
MRRAVRFVFDSFFLLIAVGIGVPVIVAGTVLAAFLFLPLPASIPPLKAQSISAPTQVYDRNGQLIATFRQFDQSLPIGEGDIPGVLKEAVISVEDRNFYKHGGVDVRGSARAFVADLRSRGAVQGGSTIYQQYVKLTYTGSQRTIFRKIREAILASQLARQTTKDEILFHYLSMIYLGDGNYGVGAAAQNYFRKPVSQLTVSEAALLAGLIPAPSAWAPRGNATAAEARRELVLEKMLQQGYLSTDQYNQAIAQRVWLATRGPAPPAATVVFPPQTQQVKFPAFVDYLQQYLINKYGPAKVYQGGLRIQTTLDPTIQTAADQAVQNALQGTAEPLEMALASVEPETGFVAAIVGGRQFGQVGSRFAADNFALGGCETAPTTVKVEVAAPCWLGQTVKGGGGSRQPGSAWKPFVLATAFAKGMSPAKVYSAPTQYVIPNCQGKGCVIHNAEPGGFGGSVDVRHATWASINTVYAQLIRDVGCVDTANTAIKLGINTAWYSSQVHGCGGAYALGEVGVSPLDMASAYGVLDNHGARAQPTPILKIIDAGNRVLEDNIAAKPGTTEVINPVVADNVTDVLRGVIQSGTGTAASIGRPAAGKTGTTSDYTNAWFAGYTPTLATAVWMGYADNQNTSMKNVKGVSPVFGGTIPAGAWRDFMSQALRNVPPTDFSQPAPIQTIPDQLNIRQRQAINPGPPRGQTYVGSGGTYVQNAPPRLRVSAPSTTTTSSIPADTSTSTTSTTNPFGFPLPP